MKPTDQIVQQIVQARYSHEPHFVVLVTHLVQDAIEKSYDAGFKDGALAANRPEYRAAQSSDPSVLATHMIGATQPAQASECEWVESKLIEGMEALPSERAAQASECNHQWTDAGTLHMPEQGPPLQIEQCVRCGVQQKKQAT